MEGDTSTLEKKVLAYLGEHGKIENTETF